MLLGEYFRRSHHTGLPTIIQSQKHGKNGNKSLATSHISLQKAIHLQSTLRIVPDLPKDPFLGLREVVREARIVRIEVLPHLIEEVAFEVRLALLLCQLQ